MSEQTQNNYSNIVSQVQAQNANALAALTSKAKKHQDMLQSLINEPIALASGELLQRGLFKVSKGVTTLGKRVGSQTVQNVADAVSTGGSLTDAITSGVKTDLSKALGTDPAAALRKAQQNVSAETGKSIKGRVASSNLASRASTTLDTAKSGAEAKRSGLAQTWADIKDKGTETRGVVSRIKSAFGIKENGTANFTTENSLSEQRAKIRETLAKTKGGRALNRKNDALDANRRFVQKQKEDGFSDLESLSLSGKKDSRLVAEQGVAPPTEATELDAFTSGYSSLKKPEQSVAAAAEPVLDDEGKPIQDETERLRQKAEARGEEPDASLAPKPADRVTEGRSASSVLADLAQRETITGSAPRARKAPKQKPTPAPAPDPAPEPTVRPSDLTGGLDPSQLPADAGFKGSGGQKIEAAKPKGEDLSAPAPEAPAVEKQASYRSLSQSGKQAHLENMIDYQAKNKVSPNEVPADVRNASLNEQSANDKSANRGAFASDADKATVLADRKVLKKNQRKAYNNLSNEGQQAVDDKATEYSKQTGVPVGQIPEQVRGNIINDQTIREQSAPPAAAVEPEQSGTSGGPVETQSAVEGEQTVQSQSQVDSSARDATVENRKTQLNSAGFNDDGKPDNENKGSSEEDEDLETGGGIAATSVMDTLTGGVGALATGLAMAFLPKLWEKDPPPPPQMNQEDVANPSDQLGDT
jgi:hypothetical protein